MIGWKLKLHNSARGVGYVLTRPAYLVIALFSTVLASSLLLWSLNLDLVSYILFDAPITFIEKVDFFWSVYRDIYTTYESWQATGLVIFSVLFGVNIALLWYVISRQGFKQLPKKSSGAGLFFAVVSGGCVACGTSLLAPLLATFGAVSSSLLRDLSLYLNWVGSLLIVFSIYSLGSLAATARSREKLNKL